MVFFLRLSDDSVSLTLVRHIPDWAPGATFKKTAKAWKKNLRAMVDLPYDFVEKELSSGKPNNSFAAKGMTERGDYDAKLVAASLLAGAYSTQGCRILASSLIGYVFLEGGSGTVSSMDSEVIDILTIFISSDGIHHYSIHPSHDVVPQSCTGRTM